MQLSGGYHLIVPGMHLGVIALHPHAHIARARTYKLYIYRIMNKCAVGAQALYRVQRLLSTAGCMNSDGGL